jgi:hypothetical protein
MATLRVQPHPQEEELTQIEQLARYLSTYPQDLIDARWLMKRFRLSVVDFQQALPLLEQQDRYHRLTRYERNTPSCGIVTTCVFPLHGCCLRLVRPLHGSIRSPTNPDRGKANMSQP